MRNRTWFTRAAVVAAVVVVVVGARAAWQATVASRGSAEGTAVDPAYASADGVPAGFGEATGSGWRLEVPGWVGALGGDDTLAVAVSANSVVTALDPTNGSPVWAHEIRRLGPDAPAVSPESVVVRAEDRVVVLDRTDGALVWETPVDGPGPVAALGRDAVLTGTRGGTLTAHAAPDGARLWEVTRSGALRATPVSAGAENVLAVWHGADRALVAALDPDDGSVLWEHEVGPAASGAVADDSSVYLGDGAGNIVALDAASGERRWSTAVNAGFGVDVAPAIAGGRVVVADRLGIVHALARTDGSEQWRVDLGVPVLRGSPTVAADTVVVTTSAGRSIMLSAEGGILGISDDEVYVSGTVTGGGHLLLGLRLAEPGRVEGLTL